MNQPLLRVSRGLAAMRLAARGQDFAPILTIGNAIDEGIAGKAAKMTQQVRAIVDIAGVDQI